MSLDTRVFLFLNHALAGWIMPMAVLSAIGSGWGLLAALPLFASKRTRHVGRSLALVLLVTALLVFGIKRLVARARPCNCLPDVHALVFGTPTDYSFPSGHSAGSFAFAVFLAAVLFRPLGDVSNRERVARRFGAVLLVITAASIGLSRVALGVHFPGDVMAGAILGSTVALIGARLHYRQINRSISPG